MAYESDKVSMNVSDEVKTFMTGSNAENAERKRTTATVNYKHQKYECIIILRRVKVSYS